MQDKKLKILGDVLGSYRRSGQEYLFSCPFCKHHKNKLSVNFDKGAKCWVCNWASPDIFRVVRRLGTRQQKDEWRELDGTVDIAEFSINMFDEKEEIEIPATTELPKEFISLTSNSLPRSSLDARRYLKSRGITKEDIFYWKIGYCSDGEYKNRIVVPSFNNEGYANYFIARTYGKDWPKYKNPETSKNIIFNELYINWEEPVVLVEGAFDAIKAGKNAVPILGSSLRESTRLFQAIVENDAAVYLSLDKDASRKTRYITDLLLQYDIETYRINIDKEDVGEMTQEEFAQAKQNAILMNFENYLVQETLAI